jgi:hypothetical protein
MSPYPLKNVPKSDRDEDGANLAFHEIGLGNRSKTLINANLTKCNLFADNAFIPHSVYTYGKYKIVHLCLPKRHLRPTIKSLHKFSYHLLSVVSSGLL